MNKLRRLGTGAYVVEKILLGNALNALYAVGQTVGIKAFVNTLYPHINGICVRSVHTEKQYAHSHLGANALDGHKRFFRFRQGN